jgi:hypothetical protein
LQSIFFFACHPVIAWYLTHNMSKTELQRLSTLALRQRKSRLLQSLRFPPDAIHASFLERFLKCGRPNCHCRQGEKHGPFFYLSRCLAKRQMRTLLLKGEPQVRQARRSVEAYQQTLESLDRLSEINWELLRRGDPLSHE